MIVVACDPGKSGGFAAVDEEGQVRMLVKSPDNLGDLHTLGRTMRTLFRVERPVVLIEEVHSMPRDGVKACFTFGGWFFAQQMALLEIGQEIEFVTPRDWQGLLGLYGQEYESKTAKKNEHKALASKLYPGEKITHATADALLIAHYGQTRR